MSVESTTKGERGFPPALRSCHNCGSELPEKVLRWAIVSLLISNGALSYGRRLAIMRALFGRELTEFDLARLRGPVGEPKHRARHAK